MDDIDILPSHLLAKSLSNREIVLEHRYVLEALDILQTNKFAVIGWEVWFRYPNGKKSHFINDEGKTSFNGSEGLKRLDNQFVKRSMETSKEQINISFEQWEEKCKDKGIVPYYCLITSNEAEYRKSK